MKNLGYLIGEAAISFGLSALRGFRERENELKALLELYKLDPPRKDPSDHAKIQKELYESLGDIRRSKIGFPLVLALTIPLVSNMAIRGEQGLPLENVLATAMASYLGRYLGTNLRRIKDREIIKDLNLLKYVRQNPEKLEEALLTPLQKNTLDNALLKIEDDIAYERAPNQSGGKDELNSLISDITNANRYYHEFLLSWIERKCNLSAKSAGIQLELRKFYDDPNLPIRAIGSHILGLSESPQAKAFIKEGKRLSIDEVIWPSIRTLEDYRTDSPPSIASMPRVTTIETREFNNDYRRLSQEVLESNRNRNHGIILMSSNRIITPKERALFATLCYVPAYLKYKRSKNRQN